eukprot:m.17207 g.17207  ORF g.17207 m.17207 type:complete len:52 (+) comp10659_c0_seq6:366-521(+)
MMMMMLQTLRHAVFWSVLDDSFILHISLEFKVNGFSKASQSRVRAPYKPKG